MQVGTPFLRASVADQPPHSIYNYFFTPNATANAANDAQKIKMIQLQNKIFL